MSNPREPDLGDLHEMAEERAARRRKRCQCGDGMPGRCPGPSNCPMCQTECEDDDT